MGTLVFGGKEPDLFSHSSHGVNGEAHPQHTCTGHPGPSAVVETINTAVCCHEKQKRLHFITNLVVSPTATCSIPSKQVQANFCVLIVHPCGRVSRQDLSQA